MRAELAALFIIVYLLCVCPRRNRRFSAIQSLSPLLVNCYFNTLRPEEISAVPSALVISDPRNLAVGSRGQLLSVLQALVQSCCSTCSTVVVDPDQFLESLQYPVNTQSLQSSVAPGYTVHHCYWCSSSTAQWYPACWYYPVYPVETATLVDTTELQVQWVLLLS